MTNLLPTYQASEVLYICRTYSLEDCRSLMFIVDDEVERYSVEDMVILMQAAMVILGRSVLLVGK